MNLDSLSFALSNISYSVANLTKKNFKSSVQEISRLVTCHGLEAERHLLRCLFSHVDFSGDGKSSGKDFHQTQLLIQECASILHKPNFVSTFCYAIDCPLQQQKSLRPSSSLLSQLSKVLKLSSVQEIAFGLALLHSSIPDHINHSVNFLKQKLPDFIRHICDQDLSSQEDSFDLPPVIAHLLLHQLNCGVKDLGIPSESKEKLNKALSLDLADKIPLLPYLRLDNLDPTMENIGNVPKSSDDSLVEVIQEMGYNFTSSVEECKNNMTQIGLRELKPSLVARILSMMARSHTGLTDAMPLQNMNSNMVMWGGDKEKSDVSQQGTWNVEYFVQAVRDMAPSLDWKEVIHELDNPDFLLKDRKGLKLLWQGVMLGLGQETLPMDRMYRRWRNSEGQFSFFHQVLNCCDIVCLTDYPHRPVLTDALKAPPEDHNKSISNWKSLDLIETLLCLSETPYFKDELFKFPLAHCPDLLILGLIQTSRAINPLHKELLSNLIPIFLGNHPNSAMVFHLAWHSQYHSATIRNIIMHAMADWYARGDGDQTRLSRILDVAQDLKALSMLLNLTPFLFVIDLACLASRREYLKLDKWLTDKVRDHGEPFVESCVNFLTRRSPQIMGGNIKEENLPKSALPTETLATMLGFLHSLAASLPQDLSEKILTMVANCATVLNKNRLPPPGVVKTSQGLQSVLQPAVINAPSNTSLDQLVNLTSSVSGLSIGSSVKSSTGNSAFPSLSIGSFTIPSSGSPAKMLSVGTPAIKSGTTNSQITQSQFSNVMASGTPQLPTQFGDVGQILTESSGPVSKEIEDEANGYFQRIYNHAPHSSLPIEDVLDMLKRFKESPIQKEQAVCSCMIKNLFEEYRFFPQYPDKELQITAQLFGGIVDQNLVSYLSLGLALRYVLESVKKPSNSKMFFFGVTAMDRFKTRLKDYPAYCQHLTQLPNFHELPQNLIEYIEYGARSQEPPLNRPSASVAQALSTPSAFPNITQAAPTLPMTTTTTTVTVTTATPKIAGKPSIANATNIDTLLVATEKDEKLINPPDSVQDKVSFIVNNLSQSNLAQKTDEFRDIIKEEYWPWASQYLVMKRASIEPNFHTLYSNFLDTLKLNDLTKLVIRETFRNIKVLLRSDKTVANFSDRSLLKNLGHWLGILTLSKCKPILQRDIDIKSLIIEAYHNGSHELLYVVPFVAKVLESCSKSKVFKPPNPWTMGIMKVLCELHKEPDLKLNLKFEIEVLCKTLNIDINEVKPSGILKDQDRMLKIESQLSPLPKHKEQQAIGSVNIQVPPQPALSNVVPPTSNPLANNVLHEESLPTLGSPPTTLSSGQIQPLCAAAPPQPHFAYGDINIGNTAQIAQHLNINNTIPLFQSHSQLKQFVRISIERAVQEWLAPVVERSVKISLTTCEQIIKKDFALDPEEARMRASAHHMIRSLTAGMVMITCRDPLFVSIITNLRNNFLQALRNPTPQQKELTEQAAEVLASENLELACCFIQKTAVEKALPEIDKRLSSEYEARKHARSEGRRYCDPVALTYQAERMPEQIRLKVGGVTPQQMAVYEEFVRMIPGFLPSGEREQQQANLGRSVAMMTSFATDESSQIYDKLINELEILLHATNHSNPHILALHSLLDAVIMARSNRDMTSAVALLQKTVDGFLEGMSQAASDSDVSMRFRDGHLLVMKALADPRVYGHQWTSKQITRWLIESREECRYNPEAVDLLIRNHLINLQAYDLHLTQSMENGMNVVAVQFAMQLVKMYLLDERQSGLVSEADLYNTVETLGRITLNQRQLPDGLNQLLDLLRNTGEPFMDRAPGSGPIGMMYSGITQAREFDDPPGLYEKTEFLLREWVTMYHSPKAGKDSTNAFSLFVHQMNLQGILKTDELITRFFRLSTEMCVDLSYRVLMDQNLKSPTVIRAKCFHTLDAYVRLIALLVKHSGDNNNTVTKVNLLNKVLGIVTGVLLQDQELRGVEFQQLPYHRIFIMLFLELSAPEPVLEAINPQILTAFCNTLYYLRPQKAPGFAYAWLELVSHRVFLGRVLALSPAQKGWTMYAQLLVSLFKFLAPFLRNVELAAPIQLLYKGTLRVLLVLLHDFPEFLCDYHYGFCDVIAPNCIQMRNLILSAFPRNMRLPDPFTPNLKVDLLPEITQAPRILANFNNLIQPPSFKKDLDSYIKTRAPVTFLSELRTSLQVSNEPGMRYNIPLINALVLYVGTQAIQYIQNKGNTPNMSTITHSSHMDIFQNLAVDSDTEGRYLFLNAIANQLRYPNSHTHYFSCTLLYLFAEANTEAIQEQITRVLLERLIVNRPHPWGLLITFIELIKNQNFKFWNHEFVRCAPEIEKLFESVARSCMHPKPSSEQTTS